MAVQRLTLAQIETAVLQAMGYSASTVAPWASQANFYIRVNEYGQRLPMRLNLVAQQLRIPTPARFDCWKTSANSGSSGTGIPQIASGSSTLYLPTDYDHYISFYDITNKRPIRVVEKVDKWHNDRLLRASSGPPRYIEIMGFVTESTNWRRYGTLYPATESGVTPSIRLHYWRLPAIMPGASPSAEYPDIDPKYESLFVYGTICDLARNTGFEYDRYSALEKELLIDMVSTARSV